MNDPLGGEPSFECAFVKAPTCDHDELFLSQYQRANRLNQTKILRCFPHCCPSHVARSYCGGSVWLQVTQPIRRFGPTPPRLCVFAHFRTASETQKIEAGSTFPIPRLGATLQSEDNTNAEWVDSKLSSKSCSTTHHVWLFEVNPSHRWYYAWRSGKMSARRMTAHAMEAVVVVDTGHSVARVVASTVSTPFTIVSFRRSVGSNKSDPGRTLTALEASLLNRFLEPPSVDSSPKLAQRPSQLRATVPVPAMPSTSDPLMFISELRTLFASASRVRLHQVYELVPVWSSFQPATDEFLLTSSPIGILVNFLWTLSIDSEIHDAFTWHAAQASKVLMDIRAIDAWFNRWEDWLRNAIADRLAKLRLVWSELVATADSVVNSSADELHEQRWSHVFERDRFIAQARQICINHVKSQHPRRAVSSTSVDTSTLRSSASTNGMWKCLAGGVRIFPRDALKAAAGRLRRVSDTTVAAAIKFWQQWSWLHVEFDSATTTLLLGSAIPRQSSLNLPCRLVLDGHYRCFDSLPHEESTLSATSVLGGQCFGDYVATVNNSSQIDVAFFSWPVDSWLGLKTGQRSLAYRWQWVLPLESRDRHGLQVIIRVSTATLLASIDDALETQSIHDRLALVNAWEDAFMIECTYHRSTATSATSSLARV